MSRIMLHPTLGVNPHLSFCPRCGGDAEEMMLIGSRTRIDKCCDCGTTIYGGMDTINGCPKCKGRQATKIGNIKEGEKLPASRPCKACIDELASHKAEVAKGGVYFKCACCPITGVLKATAKLAIQVRKQMGIEAPAPCGVQFDSCDQHTV